MEKKQFSMALIGSVLTMILTGSIASAEDLKLQAGDEEAAEVIAVLVERGYLTVNPRSGTIVMKRNVIEILRDSKLVPSIQTSLGGDSPIGKSTAKCD